MARQLIPKLIRLLGIFLIISLIEWRIAIALLVSFVVILSLNLRGLRQLVQLEKRVERYREDTDSRTAEIVHNIKTVKAFATEASELKRQRERLEREYKVLQHRVHTGYVRLNCRDADKIVVLDRGAIAEVGQHDELFQQQGIYHRLHTLQEITVNAAMSA